MYGHKLFYIGKVAQRHINIHILDEGSKQLYVLNIGERFYDSGASVTNTLLSEDS